MSAGLEPLVAAAWLTRRLTTSSALASALGLAGTADLAARVWEDDAPPGTPLPFVAWNAQSLGNDVQGVGAHIIMTDPLYTVRVVQQTNNAGELAGAATAIHAALHQQRDTVSVSAGGTTVTGTVAAARQRPFAQRYNDDQGLPFRALGGIYLLYVDG